MKYQKLRRVCKCGRKFIPATKTTKLCDKCWKESKNRRRK